MVRLSEATLVLWALTVALSATTVVSANNKDRFGCAKVKPGSQSVLSLVTDGEHYRLHGWWPGTQEQNKPSQLTQDDLDADQLNEINSLYMPNQNGSPVGLFLHEWLCHGSRHFSNVDDFLKASSQALETASQQSDCPSQCKNDGRWHECRVACDDISSCESTAQSCRDQAWTPAPRVLRWSPSAARTAASSFAAAASGADNEDDDDDDSDGASGGFSDAASRRNRRRGDESTGGTRASVAPGSLNMKVAWVMTADDKVPKLHGMWPTYPRDFKRYPRSNKPPTLTDDQEKLIWDMYLPSYGGTPLSLFQHEWKEHGCMGYPNVASFLADSQKAFASAQAAYSATRSKTCALGNQIYQDCKDASNCKPASFQCKGPWKM